VSLKARSLAELGALKRAIDARSKADAARRAAEAEVQQREEAQRHHFRHAVGPVTPLPHRPRVELAPRPAPAVPHQRQRDEQAALAAAFVLVRTQKCQRCLAAMPAGQRECAKDPC